MSLRTFLPLVAIAILSSCLAACSTFAPVYGTADAAGATSVRFNFAAPESRIEQLIYNRLKVAFPASASASDPTLDIAALAVNLPSSQSNAFAVARPINIRVEATVTISSEDAVVFSATRFTDTAYQSGNLTPVDNASRAGAEETAARSTAEAIRAAILAGYASTK